MGSNCLKAKATSRRQFSFTSKVPENPGIPFCWPRKDKKLSHPWSHPVVLSMGPLDWESRALTTRPLLLISFYISRYHFSQSFRTSFNIIGCPLTERPKSAKHEEIFFSILLKPSFLCVFEWTQLSCCWVGWFPNYHILREKTII